MTKILPQNATSLLSDFFSWSLLSRCSSWKCHVLLVQLSLISHSWWACSSCCSERHEMRPITVIVTYSLVDWGLGSRHVLCNHTLILETGKSFTRFQYKSPVAQHGHVEGLKLYSWTYFSFFLYFFQHTNTALSNRTVDGHQMYSRDGNRNHPNPNRMKRTIALVYRASAFLAMQTVVIAREHILSVCLMVYLSVRASHSGVFCLSNAIHGIGQILL